MSTIEPTPTSLIPGSERIGRYDIEASEIIDNSKQARVRQRFSPVTNKHPRDSSAE